MCVRLFVMVLSLSVLPASFAAEIVTIAGSGKAEFSGDGGPALQAGCNQTFGLEIGPDGALYWCELSNQIVRRLDLKTGVISTFAGTGAVKGFAGDGGPANKAQLADPHELRFDREGNLFISDAKNHAIRRVDGKTKVITTVAGTGGKSGFAGDGGPATKGLLNDAISVALDGSQNLLICDINNHRIRKVDAKTGQISTWAGTGEKKPTPDGAPLAGTPLFGPRTLAVSENGDVVIVLREGHAVYRYVAATKTLHHVAGTGKGGFGGDGGDAKLAQVNGPKGVALGPNGDIYLADTLNHAIRVISAKTNQISTLVGTGKPGDGPEGDPQKCQLNQPHGIYVVNDGTAYIGDSNNHKVRRLTFK
jgi:sugar lactone lactonase YvrE